jgi:hypothetical protein
MSSEKLEKGTVWSLHPPDSVTEDAPANVRCRVEQSYRQDDAFRAGMVYEESAEELSRSWIAHLLRALGYSLSHMIQRRKRRRVPATVPAEFQTGDGETSVPGTVLDIGIEGALVRAEVDWFQGTEVGLLIGPFEEHEAFYLDGVTVDLRPDGEGGWLHGVRFYPPDPARLERLWALVLHLLKQPASSSPE